MNSILPSFGKDVSIDIGTSMTRVMGGNCPGVGPPLWLLIQN